VIEPPPLLFFGGDLRTPRADRVDPEACPVCARLRESLTAALTTGSPAMARMVVVAMHSHMVQGHPNDPRNKTPAR
jgi:hypothetical protein